MKLLRSYVDELISGVSAGALFAEKPIIPFYPSPLTKTDPFMLVRNDPWNAQLIGWWFLI